MRKTKTILAVILAVTLGCMTTACGNKEVQVITAQRMETASETISTTAAETSVAEATSVSAETLTAASVTERVEITWETIASEEVTEEDYAISNGIWFYQGIEDEKSVDMDGMKGFTTYTKEAIPETDGYLQYLGVNPDGQPVFEVYDIYGQYFTTMIFISEEQFYLGGDEVEYYVKWDY